jgi:XTP/dITP diphosphohydrolase
VTGVLQLVLATANPDKAAEISAIVAGEADGRIVLLPRPPALGEVEETGATLEDNARLKAAAVLHATGLPVIADDTGLEVDALGGAPGVFSSRYSGPGATYEDNVSLLLSELRARGATGQERRAKFRTVALASFTDGTEIVAQGLVEGTIADEPRGTGGFGYDPVFVPDGADGRTYAQISALEKNARSHRARAFRALVVGLMQRP